MFRSTPGISAGQFAELASGMRLHYASCGDASKPLLLMLHGFPECWLTWESFMPGFEQTHHVVAPDMRGYNLSDKPAETSDYHITRLVRDVVELIDALGHRKALVIGHDWGGVVAWAACIAHPDRFHAAMILNAPHPVGFARALATDPAQQEASRYMNFLRSDGAEDKLLADNCAGLAKFFRAPGSDQWFTEERAAQYRAAWQQPGAVRAMLSYYRASPMYPPQGRDAGAAALELNPEDFRVTIPVRVGWGMDDSALLPVLLDGLGDSVPDLRIERIDGATHWVQHEQPGVVAGMMRRLVGEFPTG